MREKIIKTGILIVILIAINSLFGMFEYGSSQISANLAPLQVDNDASYYLVKGTSDIGPVLLFMSMALVGYVIFLVWKKK